MTETFKKSLLVIWPVLIGWILGVAAVAIGACLF
jgi:hypothetical protein